MIDIVFLLIIFFLVGTEFAEDKSVAVETTLLPVELPTSSTTTSITPGPDPVMITITKGGELFLNGNPVDLGQLREQLKAAKENYADTAVVVAGDGQSHLQSVVDVLRICEELEIRQAKIKAKKVETPGP